MKDIEEDNEFEEDDEDEDEDDDDDRFNSNKDLEVEANVYTDTTIVKVELEDEGRKTVFTTTADTEAEVVDVVAAKFGLTEAEVEAVLEFEIEDRASRTNERAKISGKNNRPVKPVETCVDTDNVLEIEADVFTNTTIVKVELTNGTKKVFETTATTSDDIAAAVVVKVTTLTVAEVKAVLDVDVEDRASRASDFIISSSNNDDDCDEDNNDNNGTKIDARLEARIAELQRLVEALIKLLNARLGN